MGKLILITGGARSGKSTFAEDMAKKLGDRILYIATCIAFDDEMKLRIRKHREQRPIYWETVEAYRNIDLELKDKLDEKNAAMLDCITIMVTNLMMDKCQDWDSLETEETLDMESYVNCEVDKLLHVVKAGSLPFILVTNEVGMGVVPEYKSGRLFRDIAGRVNQNLAKAADEVYLCISGIPVRIK